MKTALAAGLLALPGLVEAETVIIAMHYTAEQAAPLMACLGAYEDAHPGTTVDYQQLSYRDYLQTALTSQP